MKDFPQFNKQQLELIIASVAMSSFQLSHKDNLAQLMVEFDYALEHFGFKPNYDRYQLATNPSETSSIIFSPIIESLMAHYEAIPS